MTAVARAWRGRGVATALKRATIAWAVANGLEALETRERHRQRADARGERRLGYQPMPDEIYFRGPLACRRPTSRRDDRGSSAEAGDPTSDAAAGPRRVRLAARRPGPRPRARRAVHRRRPDPTPRRRGARSGATCGSCIAMIVVVVLVGLRARATSPTLARAADVTRDLPSARLAGAGRSPTTASSRSLRDLIRIPSINPPDPRRRRARRGPLPRRRPRGRRHPGDGPRARPGPRLGRRPGCAATGPAASRCSCSRTSTSCRRRRSGWTHDPFAGDVADGWIYGRGAVDMKDLVAMELEVMRLLAGEARAAGPRPGVRPGPGPPARRPLRLDGRRGGRRPRRRRLARAAEHPEHLRAAAAINEAGGVAVDVGERRLYPIQVAEKGVTVYRLTFRGHLGPRLDAPRGQRDPSWPRRRSRASPRPWPTRLTAVTQALPRGRDRGARRRRSPDARLLRACVAGATGHLGGPARGRCCSPVYGRALDAMLRDTLSPNVLHAGVKYNVIPGDGRPRDRLPAPARHVRAGHGGADPRAARAGARRGHGHRADHRLRRGRRRLRRPGRPLPGPRGGRPRPRSRTASRCRSWRRSGPTPSTCSTLGVPTFGFSPLRQPPGETYLDRYHGDRRAGLARRPPLGPARPLRCRPEVLRMTFVHRLWRLGLAPACSLVALARVAPVLAATHGVEHRRRRRSSPPRSRSPRATRSPGPSPSRSASRTP